MYRRVEEVQPDASYTNKHKLPHSHDSTGVGGHGAESSWPVGERNTACLHGRPRYILVLASQACVWSYPKTCMHIQMNTHTTSVLQTDLPPSSPSSCDCQKETAILWKTQCKFILYLLERLLHFTVHFVLAAGTAFVRSAKTSNSVYWGVIFGGIFSHS